MFLNVCRKMNRFRFLGLTALSTCCRVQIREEKSILDVGSATDDPTKDSEVT